MKGTRTAVLLVLPLLIAVGCSTTPPENLYSGYLDALNQAVTVEDLLLFEAGRDLPEPDDRRYTTTFTAGETRYVYGELRLRYPGSRGRDVELGLDIVWTDESGAERARQSLTVRVEGAWVRSRHVWGYGSDQPGGYWSTGSYEVSVFEGDTLLASRAYRIE